ARFAHRARSSRADHQDIVRPRQSARPRGVGLAAGGRLRCRRATHRRMVAGELRQGQAVKYRPLGQTGLAVSEIGFGAWGIGGRTSGTTSYGETDDRTSLAALSRALDCGVTFFDTSAAYGDGHSEL